ncbi:hypothetical protein C2G38_2028440 [Gigaspora rosea]|uniref:Uncharacterized protein n=1 Tax=Gigaspora rosea TaxID=44941 RepID=A0A397W895_9GLOM|nr:hypothetical protein C2G38_2028440 [Gigaspora rosea]
MCKGVKPISQRQNKCFICMCRENYSESSEKLSKNYKNLQGLSRHETLIHSNYNIPRVGLIPQPFEAISEFKKTLVFLIQNKLKNGYQERKQHVNAPCLESLFVGTFHGNIKRYSPSREYYYCIFSGVEAYETLSQIFKDPKWSVREYKNQQQTWVVLVSQDTNQIQPEMVIQWRRKKIKDEANHVSEAGYIFLSFMIDQIYY